MMCTKEAINMSTTIFDLIAVLYEEVKKFDKVKPENSITKEMSDALERKAKDLIYSKFPANKTHFDGEMCVNSQDFYDIINYCKEQNDFLFFRSVLCQLDSMLDIDILIKKYDFNKFDDGVSLRTFDSLNENHQETGVTIIPNVPSLPNTFFVNKESGFEDKKYKNANYWYDNVNDHFNNIICIPNNMLDGYKINNVIIDLFKKRDRDKIVIGVTPCCNSHLKELMDVHKYCNEETGTQHFAIKEYYNSQFLTDTFLKCLSLAKSSQVDILIGPEMLGSLELCEPDDIGFNQHFRDVNGQAPHLIATPSIWYDGKNYISVYLKSGELIGKQYKQNCFELTDDGRRYEEDLKDIPKEILLIHVPGWERITFPICVDLLVPDYRDLIVRHLKSNLILCPSYSTGTVQFGNASGTMRDFDTRLVWLNSCSALRKFSDNPKVIGSVTVPITNPDDLGASAKRICPKCEGKCLEGCLFTITIQARSQGDRHCNDIEIKHVPLE